MQKKQWFFAFLPVLIYDAVIGLKGTLRFTTELFRLQVILRSFVSDVHLDRDDGAWVYEIEFREGCTEYTVRASDGKVVDYDKDWDDENTSKKEAGNGFFFALL